MSKIRFFLIVMVFSSYDIRGSQHIVACVLQTELYHLDDMGIVIRSRRRVLFDFLSIMSANFISASTNYSPTTILRQKN